MAISFTALIEIRSLGNDYNSGTFDPGATLATNLTSANGTSIYPTVSTLSYTFSSSDVDHYLYIRSGTNWYPGWYRIISATGNSAVLHAVRGQVVSTTENPSHWSGVGRTSSLSSGTWTIDYTQSAIPRHSFTDLELNGTDIVSSAGNAFTTAMVGNTLRIISGTGFTADLYVISSVSSVGNTAKLDRGAGTQGSTGGTGVLGGAITTIKQGFDDLRTGLAVNNCMYVKNDGNYTISGISTITNTRNEVPYIRGYGTYRFDNERAKFLLDGNSTAIKRAFFFKIYNLEFDGQNNSNTLGYDTTSAFIISYNCVFKDLTGNIGSGYGVKNLYKNVKFFGTGTFHNCSITGCAATGSALLTDVYIQDCLIAGNSATSILFHNFNSTPTQLSNSVFYNNTCTNVIYSNINSVGKILFVYNNIFAGNSGTVYGYAGFNNYALDIKNNAYFNNGLINNEPPNLHTSAKFIIENEVVLTADPFINASAGNFGLNFDAGGGAACRYAGAGITYNTIISENFRSIGISQFRNNPSIPGALIGMGG
jgi:hypothetical protein